MERKTYLDNLRWGVVLLVILYHVVYIYNSVGVITNLSVEGIPEMDVLEYFVYPWFMNVLFVVAGMSARYALEKRSGKEFLRERVRRLLVPSVAGVFLLGWVGGWITNQYTDMFAGNGDLIPGAVKYLIYCLAGIGPLWFAHELFLGSLVLVLLRFLDRKDRIWHWCGKANLPVLLLLVFAVWGSSQLLNTPLFEVYRNGIYWFMLLLGYYLFSHEEVTDKLVSLRIPLLVCALLTGAAYTAYYYGSNYTTQECLNGFFTNFYAWLMVLAVLGCCKAWANGENRLTRYLTSRSFGFYVLHYPLLISIAFLLDRYASLPKLGNYITLLVLEALLLPLLYEAVSRIPVLRFLLLGKRKKRTADSCRIHP